VAFFAVGNSHFLRVRFVALCALRDLAVYVVTGRAVKSTMFALIVPELSNLLRVAGDTRICYFGGKRQVQRHMGVRVTVEAVLKFEMGPSRMALAALRDLTVDAMTGGTVDVTMLALIVPEQGILLRVAGETNTLVRKGHVQRSMRVLVASEAALKFKVYLPRAQVALAAFLDRLLYLRRVADMAAHARNRPVPPSGSFYVIYHTGMTLYTVFFFVRRFCLGRGRGGINREDRYPCDQEYYGHKNAACERFHISYL
jgi:hypothetical protein